MKKTIALIASGIFTLLVIYFAFVIRDISSKSRKTVFHNSQKYMWLFNDSFKTRIDTSRVVGDEADSNFLYSFITKDGLYFFSIWEFTEFSKLDLENILFRKSIDLNHFELKSGSGFNPKAPPRPLIYVEYELPFEKSLTVNLNARSYLDHQIESDNYRGFLGRINKMSFSNKRGEHLVLFDYGEAEQLTLFILYKKNNSLYMILVNSKEKFNKTIINILNLE